MKKYLDVGKQALKVDGATLFGLHAGRVETVIAVCELHNAAKRIAHRAVVLDSKILQRLHDEDTELTS